MELIICYHIISWFEMVILCPSIRLWTDWKGRIVRVEGQEKRRDIMYLIVGEELEIETLRKRWAGGV